MKSTRRQILLGISIALALAAVLGIIKYLQISQAIKAHASFQPPPEAVTVMQVRKQQWRSNVRATGDVVPVHGVTLANEVPGTVVGIGFESGTTVKAGAVLIELNSAEEAAELRGAEASRERARAILARISSLQKQSASSRDDLEAAQAQLMVAQAKVEAINAQIQKKRIVAPFDGIVGVRRVNLGQYISPGTPIVSIHSVDQLRINFKLPQQFFNLVANGQEIKVSLSRDVEDTAVNNSVIKLQAGIQQAVGDVKDDLKLVQQDGAGDVVTARVTAKDPAIDPTNRNFLIQATVNVENGGSNNVRPALRAGMFVYVDIELDEVRSVVAVPVSSVAHASYGDSVYVIERKAGGPNATVRQQMVTLGDRRGEMVAVLSGLKGDEEIVSGGVFKLRPNVAVLVSNETLPNDSGKDRLPDT